MLYQGFREFAALRYYEWHGHIGDPFLPAPQRRRPSGAAASAHAPATSMNQWSYPQGPIVLLGASYVEDWGITSLAGRSVINKGVTGQESFQLLERFDADVVANRPRAVIVWGFINDVFKAPRDRVDRSIERAKESFREIVARARAANIEPVLVTEVTLRQRRSLKEDFMTLLGRWLGRSSFQDYINGHVLATNEWLREFARQEGVTLVDIQPVLSTADNRRQREYAADDGSHFSQAGYRALTQYVSPIVEARIPR
jgi:lysophospholipase L1-like esterase